MLIFRFFIILQIATLVTSSSSAGGELLRFRLLPEESRILTYVSHPFGIVNGKFALLGGEARGEIKHIDSTGSVKLTINAGSYKSNTRLRDRDVRENYLEAERYPVITFTGFILQVSKKPKLLHGTWELTIKGVLGLHGIKREIQVPLKLTPRGRKITAEGSTKILLNDFNIPIPTLLSLRSNEHVEISFRLVGEQLP